MSAVLFFTVALDENLSVILDRLRNDALRFLAVTKIIYCGVLFFKLLVHGEEMTDLREQVLGQVVRYVRDGRTHQLDTPQARAWGRVWMGIHPLRICYKKLRAFAGRCYRKVFPKR